MRVMTTEEIQAVDLEILKRIDAVCREKGIKYWLSDGTLIGAVRHKGFIPWDDDVDVSMMRKDYERFLKEFEDDESFRLYAHERGNSYLAYARVCEMKRTFFKQQNPWTKESPGVGVDVFPIDIAPDNPKAYDELSASIFDEIKKIWFLRSSLRPGFVFRRAPFGFLKDVIHFLAKMLRRYILFPLVHQRVLNRIRRKRLSSGNASGENCFLITIRPGRKFYWKTAWFDQVIECDFAGCKFPIPVGYHERLTAEYGDYMQLPPPEQRETHAGLQTMLWRS